ncbi:hypothetical protein RNJ44_02675 [Nakaseomyces bracarensis]|uniref:Uncharacterized protein n=1 Tax=Nakaseomyces bracarensis TaxID=273131 RepID=A0ABR4NZW6_9SACH
MKISQVTLLCSATLVAASSGGLDDMANESSAQSKALKSTTNSAVASSASPNVIPPTEKTTSSKVANSNLVQNSNVISSSVAAADYAIEPSTTITTTDANGNPTTQLLWWIPETATAATKSDQTDVASAVSSATASAKTLASSVSILQKSDFSSVPSVSTTESASVSTHSRRADEPITTVTTTDSEGNAITSKVWWLPSTTYSKQSAADSSAITNSANIKDTKETTIKSVFVSSSGSSLETYTKTFTSNIRKAASISSNATSSSVNAAEGWVVQNNVIGAGSLIALAMALF